MSFSRASWLINKTLIGAGSAWGLLLVVAGLGGHVFSIRAGVFMTQGYSFVLVLFGAALFLRDAGYRTLMTGKWHGHPGLPTELDWTELGPRSFGSRLTANGCHVHRSTDGLRSVSGRQKVNLPPDESGGFRRHLESSNSPNGDERSASKVPAQPIQFIP